MSNTMTSSYRLPAESPHADPGFEIGWDFAFELVQVCQRPWRGSVPGR